MRPVQRWIGGFGLAGLLILHHDFWRPPRPRLLFGWLPEELAYRLLWLVLVLVYLVYVCRVLWRDEHAREPRR